MRCTASALIVICYAEMDQVCETQLDFNKLLDDDFDSSDDAYWVADAWKREDISDFNQNELCKQRGDDGVERFEMYGEEKPFGQADPVFETSPETGSDITFVPIKKKIIPPKDAALRYAEISSECRF